MLLELIENGIDAEVRKQEQFFALAERFRNEKDPESAKHLGDELGRIVFGADAENRANGRSTQECGNT